MILAPEPAIRSCDLGQRMPCFNSCQLTIVWMSMIKLTTGYGLPHKLEILTFQIGFSVVRTDGRTDSLVITKNWRMDGLSNFLWYGATLVRALRARGASLK